MHRHSRKRIAGHAAAFRGSAGRDNRPGSEAGASGPGCWISPSREAVDKAVAKKLFARALKRDVKADPDLGSTVERLLVAQLIGMMNMARKAGQFVTGSAKVEAAVRSGKAIAVFIRRMPQQMV